VTIRRFSSAVFLAGCTLTFVSALPAEAEAQRRRPAVRVVRTPVIVSGYYYGYPRWSYDPWYQWGPYGYPYPPYGYGFRDELTTSVKLEIEPREAEVFVDGYRAGVVDDFDGIFQRLRLRPGGHDITIYLDGYRTIHQNIYLSSGADRKIRLTMERLREGERMEAPPEPSEPVELEGDRIDDRPPGPMPRRPGAGRTAEREDAQQRRFGTLSIRVLPSDAEVFVDGERWTTPSGSERLTVELAEGRHRLEVRKSGFTTYSEEILIRRGATLTVNVSLVQ
jgi:hypothetical protein